MNRKKVFITGVTGFVGRHIAEHFHEQGFSVSGLVRDKQKFQEANIPFVTPVWGHLTEIPDEALKDISYFIHVAGVINSRDKNHYYDINATATGKLLEKIKLVNPEFERFLYISSLAAAGPALLEPRTLMEIEAPVSHYGRSKFMGEQEVVKSISAFTILRPPVMYGPYDRGMLMPFQMAEKYGIAPLIGKGLSKIDFLYIDDFAKACFDAIQSPNTIGKKYFLGGNSLNWQEFWGLMKIAYGKKLRIISIPPTIVKGLGYINDIVNNSMLNSDKVKEITSPNWTSNCEEAKRDFNFSRQMENLEGVCSTYKWYKTKGWL